MSTSRSIYFDYNASAPLAPEAAEAMVEWLEPWPSNPSSAHVWGQRARAAIEQARAEVAELLGCQPEETVFTSGGTEADNGALWGALGWPPSGHIVVSSIEHPAIVEPAEALEGLGVEVTRAPVGSDGIIEPEAVRAALTPATKLISVMAANNELGTLQPIEEIASIAHEAGASMHCDAVQAAPWIPLASIVGACDLVSISSHKLAGPIGMGALYVRAGFDLEPLLRGGGQQGGRRGGTEATAMMVGFGAACARASRLRDGVRPRVQALRDRLESSLLDRVPDSLRSTEADRRLPNTSHVCYAGCDGNALVARLDIEGIAASAGAACASGVPHGSHVLEAIGIPERYSSGPLRLSLGYESTDEEVGAALEIIPAAVSALRRAGVEAVR